MPQETAQPAEWVAPQLVRLGTVGQITGIGGGSGSDINSSSSSLS